MKYWQVITLGFIITGIIYIGNLITLDYVSAPWFWNPVWQAASIIVLLSPTIITDILYKGELSKIMLRFTVGCFMFFSPFWTAVFYELRGITWDHIFTDGLGPLFFDPESGHAIYLTWYETIAVMAFLLLIGLAIIWPSKQDLLMNPYYVNRFKKVQRKKIEDIIDAADYEVMEELKHVLRESGVNDADIEKFIKAGITSAADLLLTPAEELATKTGIPQGQISSVQDKAVKIWIKL